jgi:tripartite-type tricarboxylate transporter receptor subunit TctC
LLLASTGAILAVAVDGKATTDYDVRRDLAPVSLMAAPPYILVVKPSLPVKTTAELIAYAKANPGKLSFGSSGVGSASHLSGALFQHEAGIDILHVPYRGTGPAVTDLLGGRLDLMFAPAPVVIAHVQAGALRSIGTTSAKRSPIFADMPTVAETGLPGYAAVGWFGIFAPAATPAATVARISADVGKAMASAEVKQKLALEGAEPAPNSPDEFTAFVNAEIRKWLDVAAKAHIKLGH